MIIPYNKPIGKTSFSVVEYFKKKYSGQKIGYVGTLDPMAEGLLLMLTGADTKRCEELVSLTKEYEFEVVFGVGTDTGDVLGFPEGAGEIGPRPPNAEPLGDAGGEIGVIREIDEKTVEKAVSSFVGEYLQTVPAFSAIKVGGRKLHIVSRKTPLLENDLPKRLVKISHIELLNLGVITLPDFKKEVFRRLNLLENYGDQFRKPDVVKRWEEYFGEYRVYKNAGTPDALFADSRLMSGRDRKSGAGVPSFLIARIRAEVSKGTYIRSLACDIGKKLGVPYSTCLSIKRTKVGDYSLQKN